MRYIRKIGHIGTIATAILVGLSGCMTGMKQPTLQHPEPTQESLASAENDVRAKELLEMRDNGINDTQSVIDLFARSCLGYFNNYDALEKALDNIAIRKPSNDGLKWLWGYKSKGITITIAPSGECTVTSILVLGKPTIEAFFLQYPKKHYAYQGVGGGVRVGTAIDFPDPISGAIQTIAVSWRTPSDAFQYGVQFVAQSK